jgi:hypothetical protein
MFHRKVGRARQQQDIDELAAIERDDNYQARKHQQPPVAAVRVSKLECARERGDGEAHP